MDVQNISEPILHISLQSSCWIKTKLFAALYAQQERQTRDARKRKEKQSLCNKTREKVSNKSRKIAGVGEKSTKLYKQGLLNSYSSKYKQYRHGPYNF